MTKGRTEISLNFYFTFYILYFINEISNSLDLFSTPKAQKLAQAKYAKTAFTSEWKYENLAVVGRFPQTAQNLVI